jgi:hypothetical protein
LTFLNTRTLKDFYSLSSDLKWMKRRTRGISTALSTVILSATIISVSIFSAYVATDLFEAQNQQAEYDQAKDLMFALAVAVDSVSLKNGSASYVRFNPRAGGISFVRSWGHVTIELSNGTHSVTRSYELNAVLYRGGNRATAGTTSVLRGNKVASSNWYEDFLVLTPGSVPITWVYTQQYYGAKIWLESARVMLTELGIFHYFKALPDGSLVPDVVKVVELKFTKLDYGYTISGSSILDVKARCENIDVEQYRFSGSDLTVKVTVTIESTEYPSSPKSCNKTYTVKSDGGKPIVVYLSISDVKLYLLGG